MADLVESGRSSNDNGTNSMEGFFADATPEKELSKVKPRDRRIDLIVMTGNVEDHPEEHRINCSLTSGGSCDGKQFSDPFNAQDFVLKVYTHNDKFSKHPDQPGVVITKNGESIKITTYNKRADLRGIIFNEYEVKHNDGSQVTFLLKEYIKKLEHVAPYESSDDKERQDSYKQLAMITLSGSVASDPSAHKVGGRIGMQLISRKVPYEDPFNAPDFELRIYRVKDKDHEFAKLAAVKKTGDVITLEIFNSPIEATDYKIEFRKDNDNLVPDLKSLLSVANDLEYL